MRVALVHDYLNQYGGAERVLEAFCEMFPQAPIYTLVYDAKLTGFAFEGRTIKTSLLQKIPLAASRHRYFPIFMPYAIEQLDLSDYDLVLSDSGSYAKGIITKPQTVHISYCHTPHRYAWDNSNKLIGEFKYPKIIKAISPLFMTYIRIWDAQSADRADAFIANSEFVARRIKKYYGREAQVIYPPVNAGRFYIGHPAPKTKEDQPAAPTAVGASLAQNGREDYFLMVGRMVPYKKFSLAIEVFNRLGFKLKVIGSGPERKNLERNARSNIEFLGLVSEPYLAQYYANAQALIFPQEEDFGVVAVEAMACGRPVIAYRAGGALEIIRENEDGVFFNEQTADSLMDALGRFQNMRFDPALIREHAMRFDKERFKKEITGFINQNL